MALYANGKRFCPVIFSRGDFYATLTVRTNIGASVSINGETKIADIGVASFNLYFIGSYQITATLDGVTKRSTIDVLQPISYSVDLYTESLIPDDYQELQYIQTSGSQFIDTGFKFTSEIAKVETRVVLTQATAGRNLFGCATSYDANWFGIYMQSDYHGALYCGSAAGIVGNSYTENEAVEMSFDVTANKVVATYNGLTSTSSRGGTIQNGNSMYIASQAPIGSSRSPRGVRYYYFRIFQDNQLKREFIPCRDKSTGAVGMYDTQTRSFFGNSGSGTFISGPDV